jgi:hypothetical protein
MCLGEYRNFYEDIMSKVGEPLEEAGCSKDDVDAFLLACCSFLDSSSDDSLRDRRASSSDKAMDRRCMMMTYSLPS